MCVEWVYVSFNHIFHYVAICCSSFVLSSIRLEQSRAMDGAAVVPSTADSGGLLLQSFDAELPERILQEERGRLSLRGGAAAIAAW